MDFIDIGPAPYDETCAALGKDEDFAERNRAECRALIGQLTRELGAPPEGSQVYFTIKANSHDFGTYREVICKYDGDDEAAANYAYNAEAKTPAQWDDIARAELIAAGFAPRS